MLTRVAIVLALFGCKDREKKAEPPKTGSASAAVVADAAVKLTLEQELEAIRAEQKVPAVAAAVWQNGKLVEIAAVGERKTGDPTKVTTKDYWHLGSNGKAMTATLIAIFVDRGAIRFDDTIGKWFKKIDPGYAKVTLDQLLRHEGGAPADPPPVIWKQVWDDGDKPEARSKFVQAILAKPPAQAPGTYVYSNAGYVIAGAMLEKATGKRWEDLMREELFAKLDMKSCGFGSPGRKDVVEQPYGHDTGGTPIPPGLAADNPPGIGPAGTVHCSLEDYGKFLAVISTGAPAIVSPESMQHLLTARDAGYTGGWQVLSGGKVLHHSGSNTMWYVTTMVALTPKPEDRWVFVMASNSGSAFLDLVIERLAKRHIAAK